MEVQVSNELGMLLVRVKKSLLFSTLLKTPSSWVLRRTIKDRWHYIGEWRSSNSSENYQVTEDKVTKIGMSLSFPV